VLGLFKPLETLGHAVAATQVAAVGDREANVIDAPTVLVDEGGSGHGAGAERVIYGKI
jgi:hypothetical protein